VRIIRIASVAALAALAAAALCAAPSEGEARKRIVDKALTFKGVPYVYGAASPSAFDCSGFVQYVYESAAGISVPRNSRGQFAGGAPVDLKTAEPGDILVFDTAGGAPSHVAIYMGGGSMIHAASEGPRTGVIVSSLDDSYFGPRFIGARCYILPMPVVAPAPAEPKKAKPAPAAPKSAPKAASPAAKADDPPIAEVGFTISSKPAVVNDKIPAQTGTAIAFTITNGTGAAGSFHIVFYKADKDFKKTKILREERATIKAGASFELKPFTFAESGVYRLNMKTADNTQLMQRSWQVLEAKR
jgi:hypothetical protein